MSLFGKLVPLTQPFTQIPPEVTAILKKVMEDAGSSPNQGMSVVSKWPIALLHGVPLGSAPPQSQRLRADAF